jgi:hypothetical protein
MRSRNSAASSAGVIGGAQPIRRLRGAMSSGRTMEGAGFELQHFDEDQPQAAGRSTIAACIRRTASDSGPPSWPLAPQRQGQDPMWAGEP